EADAREQGVREIIIKPILESDLAATLHRVLHRDEPGRPDANDRNKTFAQRANPIEEFAVSPC
ncbi:MAG: hypothetical protein NTX50_16925, partial [Candidatus Sumerlaeota bacterium]|nr:hypothetical protein [Candidatus Sumerlaeota bacterium]